MTTFSATDVALEGFRITRENPRTTLLWAGVSLGVSIVAGVVSIGLGSEATAAYDVISRREPPTAMALLQALETLLPILVLGFGIQCVMVAAVYRIVLRHEDHGFGYLKLGMDELRLAVLTLIYLLMGTAFLVSIGFAAGLATIAVSGLGEGPVLLVGLLTYLFALGLAVFVAVRLSLAPVITFDRRRLAIFDSWALTKGVFWKLLGAYVLTFFCMAVVTILAIFIFSTMAFVVTGGNSQIVSKMLKPDESSIGTYFTVATIIYLAFAALLTAIYYPVMVAPAAVAYQALSGGEAKGATGAALPA